MHQKETVLAPGQNIRYSGRDFPGYVRGQPYMVFIGYQNHRQARVNYNGKTTIVSRYDIMPLSC